MFREFTLNLHVVSQFTINALSFPRINFESNFGLANLAIFFARIPWIYYLFRDNTMNSRFIHELTISLVNSLSIHYRSRQFTMNSPSFPRIYYEYTLNFANKLWNKFWYREFTVYFAKISWINNLFRDNTINSLSISRMHNKCIWCFANSLSNYY